MSIKNRVNEEADPSLLVKKVVQTELAGCVPKKPGGSS